MVPHASFAQVVLASWQNNSGDGCLDWQALTENGYNASVAGITSATTTNAASGGLPIYPATSTALRRASFPATLKVWKSNEWRINANLTFNLSAAQYQAFATNNLLSFTFSVPGGTFTGGYSQINQIVINCNGTWGYATVPYSTSKLWSATGSTNNDGSGASFQPNFYFNNGANSERSQTVTLDYSSILPKITNNGYSYLQIIFTGNNGGGAPCDFYMNNVSLAQSPTQITYTVDDFNTNGVGPENATNDDYFSTAESYAQGNIGAVWSTWFGNAVAVSFDPNVNVSGDTNSNGAMALGIDRDSASGNPYQQDDHLARERSHSHTWVPGGTTGIGYPQYTNLECDVMFDPSSASVTNTNGVLGVIRIGVRGDTAFTPDWLSYTTISDTNWHHINAPLIGTDPTAANIGGFLIAEDVNGYVGAGGLNGNQILYVDNIRFTGPVVAPLVPPPSMNIAPATPGTLRMFTTAPQYTRTELATVNTTSSWIGAPGDPGTPTGAYTKNVSYSFTLSHLTSDTSAPTRLWLVDARGSTYNGVDYTGPTLRQPHHGHSAQWMARGRGLESERCWSQSDEHGSDGHQCARRRHVDAYLQQ